MSSGTAYSTSSRPEEFERQRRAILRMNLMSCALFQSEETGELDLPSDAEFDAVFRQHREPPDSVEP